MSRLLDHRGNPILREHEKRLKQIGEATAKKYMPEVIEQVLSHNYHLYQLLKRNLIKVVSR